MMMSHPEPAAVEEETSPPSFATTPAAAAAVVAPVVETKPEAANGTVEDLERRLQLIGGTSKQITPVEDLLAAPTAAADAKPAAVPAVAAPVKGGKNALLARIMAAKEKSQAVQQPPKAAMEAPPAADLLSGFDAPSAVHDPPPTYDTNFLSAATAPPPSIGAVAMPPPPPIEAVMPPPTIDAVMPPPMAMAPPPAATAPSFEDLLSSEPKTTTSIMPPPPLDGMMMMAPPPLSSVVPAPPPPAPVMEIDESILSALDPAERATFLEEQRKIMQDIEAKKQNESSGGASAAAMAFDQRSSAAVAQVAGQYDSRTGRSSARVPARKPAAAAAANGRTVDLGGGEQVALHGSETTQKAIQDGTSMIVQCVNCQNWMQVTEDATLMFCPTCQVVSPVDKAGAASADDMEEAAQMAADMELAEKLQQEEYAQGNERDQQRERARRAKAKAKKKAGAEEGQSWMGWLTGTPDVKPVPAQGSAEIRPTNATSSSSPTSRAFVAATTGEERPPTYSSSYGGSGVEDYGGGGGARVAESKGMFSCVVDSVSTAANTMIMGDEDGEGNVHGVDSSNLLAMPNVSRQKPPSSNNNNPY